MLEVRPLQHNFLTRMRMEQLSNEPFKWLQGDAEILSTMRKGKTSFTFAVRWFNAPLALPAKRKYTPIRGSTCPKRSSAPLSMFEGSRVKGKTTDYFAINGEDHVSRNSRWYYHKPESPSALFRLPYFECLNHLFMSLRVSSSQIFMFCINNSVFLSTLFLMYP